MWPVCIECYAVWWRELVREAGRFPFPSDAKQSSSGMKLFLGRLDISVTFKRLE